MRQETEAFEQVHGRTDFPFPQLEMLRPDLENLPPLHLPQGYEIRAYRPGDERVWGEIMTEAFTPYWDSVRFKKYLLPHFGFSPQRVFFVCHRGRPVGSASAFLWPGVPRQWGYIHMVGVKKEHCGRALGYWLTVACLNKLREEDFKKALLQTEHYRIPAIKHYLRLGFRPVLVKEQQREKWKEIFHRINEPERISEFGLDELAVMSRLGFWWRVVKVSNYISWLNLKWGLGNRKSPDDSHFTG